MSQFEYLMVLAGVVVAVAMTEIVATWGRILRTEAKIIVEPLFVGWTIYVLLLCMFCWVAMWLYQSADLEYAGQVWIMVFPALMLVLVSFGLTPNVPTSGELDLRTFYIERRKRVFYPLVVFVIVTVVANALLAERFSLQKLLVAAMWISGYLILAYTKKPLVHWVVLTLYLFKMLAIGVSHQIDENL